jgi:hypothetical protein
VFHFHFIGYVQPQLGHFLLLFFFLFSFLKEGVKNPKKTKKKGVVPSTTYFIGLTSYLLTNLLGFCTTWGVGVRRGYIFNYLYFIIVELLT